ncbi:MAG TPA: right-handed parallel beta-helix repeat-containing protein [Gemmatimonadales bacterium]|nr:right-handed parallel beta-helix repeat-containing protein [Gemmatimonadales bacterium]
MGLFVRSSPFEPRGPWWRRVRLVDAIVLSLPLLVLAAYPVLAALGDYRRALQFDDYWSNGRSAVRAFADRVRALRRLPAALEIEHRLDPETPVGGVVRLNVPQDAWRRVFDDPLAGWGTWIEGELVNGSDIMQVRVRKRGDNSVHWTTGKKTFTLRTPKERFFRGYRELGFSVKDVLPSYVANSLASEFALLAPRTHVAPVFLNNRFAGMYRVVEVLDESFLRPNRRMPGNIYRGDAAERGEVFKHVPRGMFANPYIWDRVARNDRPTGPGATGLQLFLADLNGSGFEDHRRMMERLDRPALGRLLALLLVVGDPYHMDNVHNQFWYEDPSTALLVPIPWDLRLLDLDRPPSNLSDFWRAALRDPFLVDATLRELRRALEQERIVKVADSLAWGAFRRYEDFFRYEWLRQGLIPDVGRPEDASAIVRRNAARLGAWLADARVAFHATPAARGAPAILDFESRGRAGTELVALELTGVRPADARGRARVLMDRNRDGRPDPGDPEVVGAWTEGPAAVRFVPREPVALLAGWQARGQAIEPSPVHYRFFVVGPGTDFAAARPELRNRVTGAAAAVLPWSAEVAVSPTTSFSPWQYPVPRPAVHRWRGTVRLAETVRIPAGDTLHIAPGTVVRLGPDVSLVSRGVVLAQGSAGRPIEFRRADPGRPWGAVTILGPGANGSVFRHVRFLEGGGGLVDRIEYIGMVNVHRVDSAHFERVEFIANVRSDDTFHALHSHVVLRRCRFVDANSDAVDFDLSTGLIADNTFERTGGDAIDLMTSDPLVIGNRITGSGDKGISIGEASHPVVFNNYVTRSTRGIEIKDLSEPVLLNNVLEENGTGIRADRKNWRYGGGGWAKLANTVLRGNERDYDLDAYARLTLPEPPAKPGTREAAAAGSAPADDLGWLYAQHGIALASPAAGLASGWTAVAALRPRVSVTFEEDFGSVSDGWIGTGGVRWVEKHHLTLAAAVQQEPGTIHRSIDWDVAAADSQAVAVFELAALDAVDGRVTLVSDRGSVSRPFEPSGDLARFHYVAVPLPPGRYREIRISVTPVAGLTKLQRRTGLVELRSGRLELRGYRLLVLPRTIGAPAPGPRSVALGSPPPARR